jgi:hypothetical protein
MKFFEVAVQQRNVVATKRFRQDIARYCRGYPGTDEALVDFIEERRQLNSRPWGAKDSPLAGGDKNIHGLWHVHLKHGKVIVLYDLTAADLRLIAVVEHSETDTPRAVQHLGKYYQSLSPQDFQPFQAAPAAAAPQISPEEKTEISNLMYEFASGSDEDRAVLTQLMSGNSAEFLRWAQMAVNDVMSPAQKDQAIMAAFGGQPGLAASAARVLKQMGLTESHEPLAERAIEVPYHGEGRLIVLKNPTATELLANFTKWGEARGLIAPDGDTYWWNASMMTHDAMNNTLSLPKSVHTYLLSSKDGVPRIAMPSAGDMVDEIAANNTHVRRLLASGQIGMFNRTDGFIAAFNARMMAA